MTWDLFGKIVFVLFVIMLLQLVLTLSFPSFGGKFEIMKWYVSGVFLGWVLWGNE